MKAKGKAKPAKVPSNDDLLARLLRRDKLTSLPGAVGGTLDALADDLEMLNARMSGSGNPIVESWRDDVEDMLLRAYVAIELAGRRAAQRARKGANHV